MSYRFIHFSGFVVTLVCLGGFCSVVSAQRPDFSEILKQMDANGNGLLESGEISQRARPYIERAAEKANLNMDQPLPIDRLLGSTGGDSSKDDDDRDGDRSRSSRWQPKKEEPLVPGFGEESNLPMPPGFDVPINSVLASNVPLEERYDKKVIDYVDGMIRRYDKDKNGVIDSSEWDDIRWSSNPHDSDLNKDGNLSRAELCERIHKRFNDDDDDDNRSSRSSSSSTADGSDSAKLRRYAESLMKQYDKDGNKVLSKEEVSKMKSYARTADLNNDGYVTTTELATKLANYGNSGSSSSKSSSSSNDKKEESSSRYSRYSRSRSSSYSRDKKDDDDDKLYRYTPPTEKLPKGLDDWFIRNDADADGQIKMSEFSAAWTASKVAEFKAFDLNGDGVITPSECLRAKEIEENEERDREKAQIAKELAERSASRSGSDDDKDSGERSSKYSSSRYGYRRP